MNFNYIFSVPVRTVRIKRKYQKRTILPFICDAGGQLPGRDNDCVVRSMAIALGRDYAACEHFLAANGRKFNRATQVQTIFGKEREVLGKKLIETIFFCGKFKTLTLNQFVKQNPIGTFMVVVHRHMFTVKNGIIYDKFPQGIKQKIEAAWRVDDPAETISNWINPQNSPQSCHLGMRLPKGYKIN